MTSITDKSDRRHGHPVTQTLGYAHLFPLRPCGTKCKLIKQPTLEKSSFLQGLGKSIITYRRHTVLWILASAVVACSAIGIVSWARHRSAEGWNTFLAGDPRVGEQTFQEKGCSQCHSILGAGAKLAPDLGLLGAAGSSMDALVTEMWNHAPRMWEQMKTKRIVYSQFTTEEMANLFAYLYVTCYDDESGNVDRGERLFTQKGCIRCHAFVEIGGHVGPNLRDIGPVVTPILWVQTMWNHAPTMEEHMRGLNMEWPRFDGEEMTDLLAFVRYERAGTEAEWSVLPASPRRGWLLFQQKGCVSCHAIRGEENRTRFDYGSPLTSHFDPDGWPNVESLAGNVGRDER